MTTWTAAECAAHLGIKTDTWHGYVSRGRAPKPLDTYDPTTGLRVWDADAVKAMPRPGRGNYPRRPRTEEAT